MKRVQVLRTDDRISGVAVKNQQPSLGPRSRHFPADERTRRIAPRLDTRLLRLLHQDGLRAQSRVINETTLTPRDEEQERHVGDGKKPKDAKRKPFHLSENAHDTPRAKSIEHVHFRLVTFPK